MLLMPVRGRNTESEQRPSLERIRTMSPSQMEKNNKTMSNNNNYNSERGMHVNDNNINHSRYNNILHNDIEDGAFDLDYDSSINNFPRLLKSTSTAFPLLEDDDSLTLSMTHHHHLQQSDETNLENTHFHKYDNNLNYHNAWQNLERSPSITLHNDITLHERYIRPEVNSREHSKLYDESTFNKHKLCPSHVYSPLNTNRIVHVDKYNCSVGRNENESIHTSSSENKEYKRRNASDQHMTNYAGVTTNNVRSGLVQSVSRSVEREHSTDAIAPWKLTGTVESFDNLFHVRRRLQSRAFVWTSRASNSQEESKLTKTKATHADFCYCNSLEKNKHDNGIQSISNNTRSSSAYNYRFSDNNSIGDSNDNNHNFDEIKSTWLNTLSLYHDQRSKNGLRGSEENNMRYSTHNTGEKLKNIWSDKYYATHKINHAVSEIQCNEDKITKFNEAHLTNYFHPHLRNTSYEIKQPLSCTWENVKSTNKERGTVYKGNGSKSTCERIKGKVVIISPPYSSSSNNKNDTNIGKPTETNSINTTTRTKTTITNKNESTTPDFYAGSNHTQEREIISNTNIIKVEDDSSSNNDEDLLSRPSSEQLQEEQMSTRELHHDSSAHLCDVELEQTDDNIKSAVWDNKSNNNNNIDGSTVDDDDDIIGEDEFTSSDEGADLSAPSWDDETFLAPDERDELTTPPPSCSTAFANYIYDE